MRILLAVLVAATMGCGGMPTPAGKSCKTSSDCDPLYCLADGGTGNPDAGGGVTARICIANSCATSCSL